MLFSSDLIKGNVNRQSQQLHLRFIQLRKKGRITKKLKVSERVLNENEKKEMK